jgi:hypothetical protein
MEMRKCDRGHYYDASLHAECPYCNKTGEDIGRTMALGMDNLGIGNAGVTQPLASEKTRPLFEAVNNAADEGRTVALIQTDIGIDPVVGWLICVEGKERGRDYRIHTDNNYIGRSEKMDICLRGDETISRENQAIITYDAQEKKYYLSPGDGRSIVRVNNKAIFQTMPLDAYDRVMIGKTQLLFLPLCGDKFEWEKE